MGLSKASLLIGLLLSAALLVSARELAETADKKVSVEESKYSHGYYPDPDYYYYPQHHHRDWHHHGEHHHYPPTTERKTLESYDVKPDYYNPGYGGYRHGGGYPYGHHGGGYPYGHHGGGYPYGHGGYHGGYGGHYPPQGN